MNRGQIVRFQILNAPHTNDSPAIWLDVVHKGVRIKYQVPPKRIFGVPMPTATLIGTLIGFVFVGLLIAFCNSVPVASISAFLYGLFVLLPGAYTLKIWGRLRAWITG